MSANSAAPVIRYDRYRLSVTEFTLGAIKGTGVCALIAYTFYRGLFIFLFMLPFGIATGAVITRKQLMDKRLDELSTQFKEGIMVLASLLAAGYSIENALSASIRELTTLYGSEGLITREFSYMSAKIRMNRPVETVLDDLAARSGLEEIKSFSEVFSVAKRSSGDLGSIMRHTAEVIRDKIQVREEIATMTASQRFEQKIMNLIPFLIVFYVEWGSPGFFDQMYETSLGRMVMTACLGVYAASYIISAKILDIGM